MRQSMLTDEQASFLREEKEALSEIRLALAEVDLPREALITLQEAILQLDELFLMVIVGEFNAGKSALVNALLGERVLPEGATPTTSRVTLVKWGEQAAEQVVDENFSIYTYPLPLLKELNIVDTPGTNAVIRHHERLTDEFVPRSDLVLFTTSADHPMTESERQFLERILAWGKKVVFVLNKADIIDSDLALQEVRTFVLKHATTVLGDTPDFFPVSARLAQRALSEPDPEQRKRLWDASGLGDLDQYITDTLDDATRLHLKFGNPLGVAENLVAQAAKTNEVQSVDLKEDQQTAGALEATIHDYERDLQSELSPRLAELENILHKLEQRGLDFFDNTLRLTNIQELMRGDKVRAQFEKKVLAEVPQQIEDQVHRLIDWLVQKDLQEWQRVMTYVQRRRALHGEKIVGEGMEPREIRRRELVDSMGKTVQRIIDSYDRDREARELAAHVETAVAQMALLEVGAVGLGTLVTAAVLSSRLDVTGILTAGTLAILGFFVIPYKRKQAKDKFREKMVTLRTNLIETLRTQLTTESENAVNRLKDGVTPYIRYVRAERERIDRTETTLAKIRGRLSELRARSKVVVADHRIGGRRA
ncbi:MAG TPA: dynamin family protein [Anaerolineales bacterium]|nr:dynamin family protein [Anaerolineales bacterium]